MIDKQTQSVVKEVRDVRKVITLSTLSGSIAAFALMAAVVACAPLKVAEQDPARVIERVCPLLEMQLNTLTASGVFTGPAEATLVSVRKQVDDVCAPGTIVTNDALASITANITPRIADVVAETELMTPAEKKATLLALSAIATMVELYVSRPTNAADTTAATGMIRLNT